MGTWDLRQTLYTKQKTAFQTHGVHRTSYARQSAGVRRAVHRCPNLHGATRRHSANEIWTRRHYPHRESWIRVEQFGIWKPNAATEGVDEPCWMMPKDSIRSSWSAAEVISEKGSMAWLQLSKVNIIWIPLRKMYCFCSVDPGPTELKDWSLKAMAICCSISG